jgi:hypothetical protein
MLADMSEALLGRGTFSFLKKASKDRKLKLPAELAAVYEEYVSKYGIDENVFPREVGGHEKTANN